MLKTLSLGLVLLIVSVCASYGVVDNTPQKTVDAPDGYSIRSGGGRGWGSGEIGQVLAFSGGGTRAAALAYGVRFSFVQEYFNLLCSDISDFSVARAVTASSAVPVVFQPVVVENYQDCKKEKPAWLLAA